MDCSLYFIFPIPNEVFLAEIVPHLNLAEWLGFERVSKLWSNNRDDIYGHIKHPGRTLGILYNNEHFLKIVPKLVRLTVTEYSFYKFWPEIPVIGLLPTLRRLDVCDDHYFSNYIYMYDMPNAKNITDLSFSNPDLVEIYTIVEKFPNLEILYLNSVEGANYLDNKQIDIYISELSELKKLKRLSFDVESHNRTWDFSRLKLDYFSFQNYNIQVTRSINMTSVRDAPANIMLKLPRATEIMIDVDLDLYNDLADQLVTIKPELVTYIYYKTIDWFEYILTLNNIKVVRADQE